MLDADKSLFDIDVRSAVLAHGPELYQMAVRAELLYGEQYIQSPHHIVNLGKDGVLAVYHRIWRRALFREMHDRVGFKLRQHRSQKIVIGDVAGKSFDS